MATFRQVLTAHSATVLVNTTLHEGGFTLTGPSVLGHSIVTSLAVTQQILASPEFDQLLGSDKAARILEVVLAQAAR
ncbi:hypothetical protein [Hymenobacter psoromatis]|uniref:hypothetical protein n=1 Tax=Hymenobacter psoromatis TaxID=1484116 RepID=UPI001CC09884|nr:hypothetical protein [Hymenobacter psoromatis]